MRASKIYLSNPEKTNSFIKCHHFFPSSHQRKLLGELLFLIEIKIPENLTRKSLSLAEEIAEIIINGLRTNYYAPEALKEKEVEENFENSLQKLNRLIYQEIIGSRSFELIIKKLNAVIGLIHEEKIYFSSVGSAQVFILKKNKIIDLISEEVSFTPSRIFSQIISGNLERDDCLFFSTANFLDYFVFEKLSQIVQKNPVEESAQKLKEVLKNLKDKISIGAILIKKERPEEIPEEISDKIAKREREKKEIKKEAPAPLLERAPLKITVEPEKEEITEKILVKEEKIEEKKEEPVSIKTEEKVEEKKEISKIERPKFRLKLPKISFAFLKKIHFPRLAKIILPKIHLPRIHLPKIKIKIVPLVIFIILCGLFIYNSSQNKVREKEITDFFLSLQEIRVKIALLNASLSYGDQRKAETFVEEIKNKIGLIKPKTKQEKEIFGKIKKDFESITDRIYDVKRTEKPEVFADLSSISRKEGVKNVVRIANGNFLILNLANNGILEFNLKNNKTSLLAKTDLAFNRILNYTDKELLLVSDNQIKVFNLETKKTLPLKIETARKNFSLSDLRIFDNKLYILDTKANQIFKYLKTESSFGNETSWLKDNVNLKDINSFALDGSIYLLKNSGELTKFFLGRKQPFSLENIYPALTKPTKVYTNEDMRNIYILEPTASRILIYNKSGKLQKQIFSEEFADLKDFVVDEKANKLWLLNDAKIFTIDLKK